MTNSALNLAYKNGARQWIRVGAVKGGAPPRTQDESAGKGFESSCVVRHEELFTLEELGRACGRLKVNTAPGIDGVLKEILREVIASSYRTICL